MNLQEHWTISITLKGGECASGDDSQKKKNE